VLRLSKELARRETEFEALQTRLETHTTEVRELQDLFRSQFRNLANEILEEKSIRFTEQNKIQLGTLLGPLKERILEFEKKVEQANIENIERNSALKEQIVGLRELNRQITREAGNLAKALRGDAKARGNWGEVVLERILEKSGLERGREYAVQQSFVAHDGRRLQPDVVVKLPEKKNIVIDSKVSLLAYERYVNAGEEENREQYLKEHLLSVRNHMRDLRDKNYHQLYGVEGLDFVLLFMPVEPAFTLALQHDERLFTDAYDRNIVVVSPSTLLATLRTIASIWRQEKQNRYAVEIAEQGGKLYDKFKDFTDNLLRIGEGIESTRKAYDMAMKRLSEGRDNLIRKTERLRDLGAKARKSIDAGLLDRSADD
jgi:DNA recombination protein RmuC